MLQRLEDEQLAERTGERELRERHDDRRVRPDERKRRLELRARRRGVEHWDARQREDRDDGRERGAEDVDPEHHLLARYSVPREDLVLRRVRRPVDEQVDQQVRDADELRVRGELPVAVAAAVLGGLGLAGLLVPEAHEHGDPERDHRDDEVLVARELAAVQEDIHDHDRHQLARLAEDHRGVRDVRQRGEAERCGRGDENGALEVAQQERAGIEAGIGLVVVGMVVAVRLRVPVCRDDSVCLAIREAVGDGLWVVVEAESLVEGLAGLSAQQDVE